MNAGCSSSELGFLDNTMDSNHVQLHIHIHIHIHTCATTLCFYFLLLSTSSLHPLRTE